MKASLVALSLVLSLAVTLSAQPVLRQGLPAGAKPQGRMLDPAAMSNMLAKTGGLVQQPVSGPSVVFLNAQTRVPAAALASTTDQMRSILRLAMVLQSRPSSDPVTEALKALADTNTAAVVVIADAAGYPALLVAPESRWALVNIAALDSAGLPAAQLTERVQKEVWRAFGFVMGAANSAYVQCLMKPVFTPEDLDALRPKTLCPEPFGKIIEQAQKLGMKLSRTTTYKKAAEEGWAPAPTNDVQRAIRSELKK